MFANDQSLFHSTQLTFLPNREYQFKLVHDYHSKTKQNIFKIEPLISKLPNRSNIFKTISKPQNRILDSSIIPKIKCLNVSTPPQQCADFEINSFYTPRETQTNLETFESAYCFLHLYRFTTYNEQPMMSIDCLKKHVAKLFRILD